MSVKKSASYVWFALGGALAAVWLWGAVKAAILFIH
jgi:hypothetical protein